jgi:Flp pilus assembly protein TadG
MRRWRRWADRFRADDDGSASLEFVAAGLILLLPIVYLVLALASIQAGAFAAEAAARQAARLFVQQQTLEAAQGVADRAIQFALADYGVDERDASVEITCAPAACLEPGAVVTVVVTVAVPLPLAPAVLQGNFPLQVTLEGVAAQRVSRFGAG